MNTSGDIEFQILNFRFWIVCESERWINRGFAAAPASGCGPQGVSTAAETIPSVIKFADFRAGISHKLDADLYSARRTYKDDY